ATTTPTHFSRTSTSASTSRCASTSSRGVRFMLNKTATAAASTLTLHDALPIYVPLAEPQGQRLGAEDPDDRRAQAADGEAAEQGSEEHRSELQSPDHVVCRLLREKKILSDQHAR